MAKLSSRMVMVSSSVCLAAGGIACLFFPVELLAVLEMPAGSERIVQLTGALYLGFAAANWAARGSMIGGIYSRPLSLANFVHFFVGAASLLNGITAEPEAWVYALLAVVYVLFGALFMLLFFGRLDPVRDLEVGR